MRRDVVDGVLDMYGYEEEILESDRGEKARYLVMKSLRTKRFTPWSVAEKGMLQRVVNTLAGGNYAKDEALDIALTCVYDMRHLGWNLGGVTG